MKAKPSFQCSKPKPDQNDDAGINLEMPYSERRLIRRSTNLLNGRRKDETFLVDLSHACDFDTWFEGCMDSKISLNVKGPTANLHWTFTAVPVCEENELKVNSSTSIAGDNEPINRRVITETRPFQSRAGQSVPQILPNFNSQWYKHFKNIDSRIAFNMESFKDDLQTVINNSEEMKKAKTSTESESDSEVWELLGMRGFKTPNNNITTFNILNKMPPSYKQIKPAPFDDTIKAQLIYNYNKSIQKNPARTEDDKTEVSDWIKTMPPRPENKTSGFKTEASTDWVNHLHGPNAKLVLERVITKSINPNLRRPDTSSYSDSRSLKTDQAIIDSLPEEEFFSSISNSHNIEQAHMNKLANIAFGNNSSWHATQVLKLLLKDDIKEAKKKIAEEAKQTPEAIAAKEEKKRTQKEKRKKINDEKRLLQTVNRQVTNEQPEDRPQLASSASEPVTNLLENTPITHSCDSSESNSSNDLEEIEKAFFETKSNATNKKIEKTVTTKFKKAARKAQIENLKKTMNSKSTSNTCDSLTTSSVPSEVQMTKLQILTEAHHKMINEKFEKINVKVDTDIPLNSLVIVKVASELVEKESIAILLSLNSKNKRHTSYNVEILNCSNSILESHTVSHQHLFLVQERNN